MNAKVDTMFTVTSSPGMSMNMPRNEIGIPRLTQKARRNSRNTASNANTSARPATPFPNMSPSRSISTSAWFIQLVSLIPSDRLGALRCR